jgi:hypothetical protein
MKIDCSMTCRISLTRRTLLNGLLLAMVSPAFPALICIGRGKAAYAEEAIASHRTNINGVIAEIIQCNRNNDMLDIQIEFKNHSGQIAAVPLFNVYDSFYFTSGRKKYFLFKDADGKPLSSYDQMAPINPGASWTWWGKYPAPPQGVNSITFYTQLTVPFEDLPITD